jgi:hypothetical protein
MQSNLTIKDLPDTEELDGKTMSAVRGGGAYSAVGGNYGKVFGGSGFASPTIGVQVGPIVNTVDASTHLDLTIPTIQNFGGKQLTVL